MEQLLFLEISKFCGGNSNLFQNNDLKLSFGLAFQKLFGIRQNLLNRSCKAHLVEQLLFWQFFKLLRKFKSNFENTV